MLLKNKFDLIETAEQLETDGKKVNGEKVNFDARQNPEAANIHRKI